MKLFLNPNEMVASSRQGVSRSRAIFGVKGVKNELDAFGEICLNPAFLVRSSIGAFRIFSILAVVNRYGFYLGKIDQHAA